LFKIIPVKKQGKYNLNVQLQDLGTIIYNYIKLLLCLYYCQLLSSVTAYRHLYGHLFWNDGHLYGHLK